jgi:hypothetical protein
MSLPHKHKYINASLKICEQKVFSFNYFKRGTTRNVEGGKGESRKMRKGKRGCKYQQSTLLAFMKMS